MSDETETPATGADTAPVETTTAAETKPNTAALAALGTERARRGPGRPPKVRPVSPAPAADDAPAAAAAERTKRKKPSGRKKTRAELAALVKQYQRGETPTAVAIDAAPEPSAAPLVAGNDAAKQAFARGVSRAASAVARFVARRRGAHWQLGPGEGDAFGEAAADCLEATEEMVPSLTPMLQTAVKLAPFLVLAAVSYDVIDSRVEIDQKIAAGEAVRVMPAADSGPQLVTSAPR
jgi:hypothetical protein